MPTNETPSSACPSPASRCELGRRTVPEPISPAGRGATGAAAVDARLKASRLDRSIPRAELPLNGCAIRSRSGSPLTVKRRAGHTDPLLPIASRRRRAGAFGPCPNCRDDSRLRPPFRFPVTIKHAIGGDRGSRLGISIGTALPPPLRASHPPSHFCRARPTPIGRSIRPHKSPMPTIDAYRLGRLTRIRGHPRRPAAAMMIVTTTAAAEPRRRGRGSVTPAVKICAVPLASGRAPPDSKRRARRSCGRARRLCDPIRPDARASAASKRAGAFA